MTKTADSEKGTDINTTAIFLLFLLFRLPPAQHEGCGLGFSFPQELMVQKRMRSTGYFFLWHFSVKFSQCFDTFGWACFIYPYRHRDGDTTQSEVPLVVRSLVNKNLMCECICTGATENAGLEIG